MIIIVTKMAASSQKPSKCKSSTTTRPLKGPTCLLVSRTPRTATSRVFALFTRTYDASTKKYSLLLRYIDPCRDSTPRASTVLWSTICFVAFVISGGFAVGYPKPWMRLLVLAFNSIIFVVLAILIAIDFLHHGKPSKIYSVLRAAIYEIILGRRVYRRNLANTILVFISTVVTMTVLYEFVWYKGLNLWILQTWQERIVRYALH